MCNRTIKEEYKAFFSRSTSCHVDLPAPVRSLHVSEKPPLHFTGNRISIIKKSRHPYGTRSVYGILASHSVKKGFQCWSSSHVDTEDVPFHRAESGVEFRQTVDVVVVQGPSKLHGPR